jgi:serine/threonine protein kinase
MGTLSYMSPEQSLGQTVDHRTDIFSLGVVLYEMITGAKPFTGESPASVSDAIAYYASAPLRRERPETPSALERVINRALEKDCASRYQTAAEMRDELQQLVHEAYLRLIDQTRRYSIPRSSSPLAADDGVHPAGESPLDPGTRQTAWRTGRRFFDPSAGWWVGLLCFAKTSSGLYFL